MKTAVKTAPISKPVQEAVSFSSYFKHIRDQLNPHREEFVISREIHHANFCNLKVWILFFYCTSEVYFISISKLHKISLIFQVRCFKVYPEPGRFLFIDLSVISPRKSFDRFLAKAICDQLFFVIVHSCQKWTKILLLSF